MRRTSSLLLAPGIIVGIVLLVPAFASRDSHAAPPAPILVELFTSEGCSDCPPADALLEKLIAGQPASGVAIIGLGQHVDYWDRLGWKDRFSSAALTERQQLYQARFRTESIYTPQMVVDGRVEFVGSDTNAARRAIERASTWPHGLVRIDIDSDGARPFPASARSRDQPAPPALAEAPEAPGRQDRRGDVGRLFPAFARSQDQRAPARLAEAPEARRRQGRRDSVDDPKSVALQITVSDLPPLGRGDRADIVVAVTEDHLRSDVKRGENHGRMLAHAAVVRYLAAIGQAAYNGVSSARADIPLGADWQRDQLKVVAFVQELRGRTILASASVSLQHSRP